MNASVQANTALYSITIPAQTPEKPDTWHAVKVRLDRKGVTVRTQPGYYAQP